MNKGIIGKKLGMTQIFTEDGTRIPVTVVQAGPCIVTQKKVQNVDGYSAVQIGFESMDAASANKPILGHCTKSGHGVFRYLKEIKLANAAELNLGDSLTVEQFLPGDYVDVTGTSIGKGFPGRNQALELQGRSCFSWFTLSQGTRFDRCVCDTFTCF